MGTIHKSRKAQLAVAMLAIATLMLIVFFQQTGVMVSVESEDSSVFFMSTEYGIQYDGSIWETERVKVCASNDFFSFWSASEVGNFDFHLTFKKEYYSCPIG